jgi:hypothetical protein
MKTYKVVGWYALDPHDEASTPYSLVVQVQAINRSMAFDDGEVALRKKAAAHPGQLLNWYVQEVKS